MKLHLEFLHPQPAPWSRWALFVVGVALAAELGLSYMQLSREFTAITEKGTPAKVPGNHKGIVADPKETAALQAEIARAVAAMDDLARPWETLFEALESIDFDRVALLSVQPDADSRALTLTGEAKAYADLLTYVARLKDKRVFSSVMLTSHEVRDGDPFRPYLFTTRADWRGVP